MSAKNKSVYRDDNYTIPLDKVDFLDKSDYLVWVNGVKVRLDDKFDEFKKQYDEYLDSYLPSKINITNYTTNNAG
jgi:hypothetical protein